MRLIINGLDIDLYDKSTIAQTKQANDLSNIATRQANYTNKFKVPATANNVRAFDNMGLPGNNSLIPYRKNECYLYGDSGECFVRKGWAVITDSSGDYEVTIYDGIYELYKAIENTNLSDYGLTEIDHVKNVANVIATWVNGNTLNYRYILADFNGKTGNTEIGEVNIDYIMPSVKVSYLWDKIFAETGFTYSGSIFLTQAFKNLWLTYPKGLNAGDADVLKFKSEDYSFYTPRSLAQITNPPTFVLNKYYAKYNSTITNALVSTSNHIHMKVAESGTYRIKVTGTVKALYRYGQDVIDASGGTIPDIAYTSPYSIKICKNADSYVPYYAPIAKSVADNIAYNTAFDGETTIVLQANETVGVIIQYPFTSNRVFYVDAEDSELTVELYRISEADVNFTQSLSDFSTKDFLTEIVQRFGLTIFTSKENPLNYEFRTLQEVLQNTEFADWSDKFSKRVSEAYTLGQYAQRNYLRYKYNDEESTYNDGYISVNNENLADTKDIIKSKTYSPEKDPVQFLGRATNVYKLWDKEPNTGEDAETNPYSFKPLDKRYHFLRAERYNDTITAYSELLTTSTTTSGYFIENFFELGYQDAVTNYYQPFQQIFDNVQVLTCELWLKEADVANIDFRKLYYFKQTGNYYLLNKINNYIPGNTTKAEFVRVRYSVAPPPPKELVMTELTGTGGVLTATFTINYTVPTLMFQYSNDYGITWINSAGGSTSPRTKSDLPTGVVYYVRMHDPINGITSNYYSVLLNP